MVCSHSIMMERQSRAILFSALVWGSSVKHNPQRVGKDHVLSDEDVVQIIKKWVHLISHRSLIMEFNHLL